MSSWTVSKERKMREREPAKFKSILKGPEIKKCEWEQKGMVHWNACVC